MERVRIAVNGRVQGVGYRWFTRERARRWGLSGWVRNCPDGSVEILVEGEAASIDGLIVMLKQGPPGSHVDDIRREPGQGSEPLPNPFMVVKS